MGRLIAELPSSGDSNSQAPGPRGNWFSRALWIAFALALPIVCFAIDTVLCVYGSATSAARLFVAVELILFAIWEWRGVRTGLAASLFAAAFAVGCGFATLTGVFLLPIALPASFFLIGLLGLVPFGTALVYWLLAHRAFERVRGTSVGGRLAGMAMGVLLATVPFEAIRICERRVGEHALAHIVANHYASYVRAHEAMSVLPRCDTSRLSDNPGPLAVELRQWCDHSWLEELRDFAAGF